MVFSKVKGKANLRLMPLPRIPLMATVSKGILYLGTKLVSIAFSLPNQTMLCPCFCKDCATARAGKICPPVPPAAIKNVLFIIIFLFSGCLKNIYLIFSLKNCISSFISFILLWCSCIICFLILSVSNSSGLYNF